MNTKEKMLLAAAEEFSNNGYHATTTRNICDRANVNIAAVNYHFRTKEILYNRVVDYLFNKTSGGKTEHKLFAETEKEWREGIFNWVLDILTTVTSFSSLSQWKNKILFREMIDPSEHFSEIFKKYFEPYFEPIEYYVRRGLPDAASKEDVYIIIFSLLSQCLFYHQNKVIVQEVFISDFLTEKNRMEKIASYITDGACSRLKFRKNAI